MTRTIASAVLFCFFIVTGIGDSLAQARKVPQKELPPLNINYALLEEHGFFLIARVAKTLEEQPKLQRLFVKMIGFGVWVMEKVDPPVANSPGIIALKKALRIGNISF